MGAGAWPKRVENAERAKQEHPAECALLVPALDRSDPSADEVLAELDGVGAERTHQLIARATRGEPTEIASLSRLIEETRQIPDWVDWARIDRAGQIFFRAGLLGGITLGMRSLVYGYAAPVGNKPLAFSGALETKAQRRLAETSQFVRRVCTQGELRPGRSGYEYSIHVRLMHARVRRLALADPRWDHTRWGLPINQHDMLATILLFSVVFIDGLKLLGLSFSVEEEDDFQALWRLVGHYLGVEAALLPISAEHARRQANFVRLTQGAPDDDSRALVGALMNEPYRHARTWAERRLAAAHVALVRVFCGALLDVETARGLGLQSDWAQPVVGRLHGVMRRLEPLRERSPSIDQVVRLLGERYWTRSTRPVHDAGPLFVLPQGLFGRSRG